MRFKKTEVCQTCSKLKNVCQTCLLDLEYGEFCYKGKCSLQLYIGNSASPIDSSFCTLKTADNEGKEILQFVMSWDKITGEMYCLIIKRELEFMNVISVQRM